MSHLKFAFHKLLKNPGFTAVSMSLLRLGISAYTMGFSIETGLLLRSLPLSLLPADCPRTARQRWINWQR